MCGVARTGENAQRLRRLANFGEQMIQPTLEYVLTSLEVQMTVETHSGWKGGRLQVCNKNRMSFLGSSFMENSEASKKWSKFN